MEHRRWGRPGTTWVSLWNGSSGYSAVMADSDPTQPNPEKDPEDWVTGEEPATGPQLSYLQTLAQQAGEELPEQLTKAQASQLIDALQAKTGRGSA